MALSKDDVRAALAKVSGPDGKPLPETGTLSDIVVTDGKVFFSITVDAAAVPQWEPVRARAEQAVRALAGVTSALVALTGERSPGAGGATPQRRPQAQTQARPKGNLRRPARSSPVAARRRLRPAFPASAPLSRSLPARAASANRPRPSILRLACAISGSQSAFSTPIFTGRRCRNSSVSASAPRRSAARGSNRSSATACR